MFKVKPHLIFTKYTNSFSVYIKNLEELSVEQIQQLQDFAAHRKGVFDFNSYTFVIQKRLEFEEFSALLKHTGIEAQCEEKVIYRTTDEKIEFGKYKGMKILELPDTYLLWLKSNYRGSQRESIENEIQRRSL